MSRLLFHRMRGVRCVHWPCRRCNRAGRTSWRSREAWHAARRRRTTRAALAVTVPPVVGGGWLWLLTYSRPAAWALAIGGAVMLLCAGIVTIHDAIRRQYGDGWAALAVTFAGVVTTGLLLALWVAGQ